MGKIIHISKRLINMPNVIGIIIPVMLIGRNCRLKAVPLDCGGMIFATNEVVIGMVIMLKKP